MGTKEYFNGDHFGIRCINTVNEQNTIYMTLMTTSAQVVETSVKVTNNSPSQDYSHPDDQTTQTTETLEFKPFTIITFIAQQF